MTYPYSTPSAQRVSTLPDLPASFQSGLAEAQMRQNAFLRNAPYHSSIIDNIVNTGWPLAIPCPFKYLWSVFPRGPNQRVPSNPSGLDTAAFEIPAGQYFLPYATAYTSNDMDLYASSSRDYTFNTWHGAEIIITIGRPSFGDIALQVTITGGPEGTVVINKTLGDNELGHISSATFYVSIAQPWDAIRQVHVTWTGGSTALANFQTLNVYGVLYDMNIPTGWDLVDPGMGRTGHAADIQYFGQCVSAQEFFRSSNHNLLTAQYNDGSDKTDLYNPGGFLRAGCIDVVTLASIVSNSTFCTRSGSIDEWVNPTDDAAPYVGFPTVVSGTWRVSSLFTPGNVTSINNQAIALRSWASARLILYSTSSDTFDVEIKRNSDWSKTGSYSTSEYTDTFTHTGSGWESFDLALTYPYEPFGGDGIGYVKFVMSSPSLSMGNVRLVAPDYTPPPVNIPTSDGDIVPGAISTACPNMAGITYATVPGSTIAYSDLSGSIAGPWLCKLTGITGGMYIARGYTSGGGSLSDVAILGRDAMCYSPGATSYPCIVPDGTSLVLLQSSGTTGWSTYNYPNRSTRTLDHISIVSVSVSPNALSLGSNDLLVSDSTWGMTTTGLAGGYLFQQFTSGAAGTYRFTLTRSSSYSVFSKRLSIWYSKSDQYCGHTTPDMPSPALYYFSTSNLGVISAPVQSTTSQSVFAYMINSGTGDWDGLNGYFGQAQSDGIASHDLDWRLTSPPNGTVCNYQGGWIKLNGQWNFFGDATTPLCSIDIVMGASETVYLRIADMNQPQFDNGGTLSITHTSSLLNMTVAAV